MRPRVRVVRRGRDRGADAREAQVGVGRRARPRCSPHTTDTSVPGPANCLSMIVSARIGPAGSMVAARAILGLDAAGLSPAPGRVVVRESA